VTNTLTPERLESKGFSKSYSHRPAGRDRHPAETFKHFKHSSVERRNPNNLETRRGSIYVDCGGKAKRRHRFGRRGARGSFGMQRGSILSPALRASPSGVA